MSTSMNNPVHSCPIHNLPNFLLWFLGDADSSLSIKTTLIVGSQCITVVKQPPPLPLLHRLLLCKDLPHCGKQEGTKSWDQNREIGKVRRVNYCPLHLCYGWSGQSSITHSAMDILDDWLSLSAIRAEASWDEKAVDREKKYPLTFRRWKDWSFTLATTRFHRLPAAPSRSRANCPSPVSLPFTTRSPAHLDLQLKSWSTFALVNVNLQNKCWSMTEGKDCITEDHQALTANDLLDSGERLLTSTNKHQNKSDVGNSAYVSIRVLEISTGCTRCQDLGLVTIKNSRYNNSNIQFTNSQFYYY